MRNIIGIAVLSLATFCFSEARASTITINFSASAPGITTSGTLTLTSTASPNIYTITGITGNYQDTNDGISGAITGLNPATSTCASLVFDATGFGFDNLFYLWRSAPACDGYAAGAALDGGGLDFFVGSTYEVNIWGNGGGANGYIIGDGDKGCCILEAPSGNFLATPVDSIYISDSLNNRIRAVSSSSGIIDTAAGNGAQGFTGDGGPAMSAELHTPFGLAVDASGNIYIADTLNNRVREVSTTGTITTVAGTGAPSYSGDGGPAVSAGLNQPTGVAVDASGDLYIADQLNNRIRKVTAGTITTVAGNGNVGNFGDGGPATSAELYHPTGIAVDGSGNLYIADYDNNRIREVSTTGTIATIAGNGNAGYSCANGTATSVALHTPYGVAVDGAGNVYIADYGNQCIRKVTAGNITTVAGNGTASYGGDGGPATSAELNYPTSVAVDIVGNLYIADYVNNRVRMVNLAGTISTIAGTGTPGFTGDGGPGTSAELYNPTGVAVGPPIAVP